MNNPNGRALQLVVLSGKGGTGKTSLTAAFAHLSSLSDPSAIPVFVDADVDAANLSLVLQPIPMTTNEFWGGWLAARQSVGTMPCCQPQKA